MCSTVIRSLMDVRRKPMRRGDKVPMRVRGWTIDLPYPLRSAICLALLLRNGLEVTIPPTRAAKTGTVHKA